VVQITFYLIIHSEPMATIFDQSIYMHVNLQVPSSVHNVKVQGDTTRGVFGLGTNQCLCACASKPSLSISTAIFQVDLG